MVGVRFRNGENLQERSGAAKIRLQSNLIDPSWPDWRRWLRFRFVWGTAEIQSGHLLNTMPQQEWI